MTVIKSPEDLIRFREQVKSEIDLRQGPKDVRVTVHMGTCGIAAGARDVLAAIIEEVGAAKAAHVTVQQTGCAGLCDQEPMLTITDKSGAIYRYGRLDRPKSREVVQNHVLRGAIVHEHLIKD